MSSRAENPQPPGHSSLRRSVSITALGNMAAPVTNALTIPLLASELGAVGRGDLATAVAPVILATTAATVGIPDALTHYVARSATVGRIQLRLAAVGIILSGGLSTLVIVLMSDYLADGNSSLGMKVALAALVVIP